MKTGVIRSGVAVVGICGLCAAGTDAAMYQWDWTRGEPIAAGLNDNGGTFESINTSFDTVTNEFLWEVTFSDQVTQGYTLVVSPGPNPKGHPGELAIFYLDARNVADPKMSVYAYNGENTQTSYRDGAPLSGTQIPDRITNSSGAASLFPELSVVDHSGKRTITFRMDATDVNAHFPLYPNSEGNDWTGAAYGSQLGIWFHPVKNLSASYNDEGFLTDWSGQQGWIDGAGFTTTLVPTPGSVVLGAMGGALMIRRRRRSA